MSRWDKICNNMLLYLVLLACALTKHAEEVMEGSVGFKNKALSLVTFWLVVRCCCPYAAYLGQLTSKWWICGEQRLGPRGSKKGGDNSAYLDSPSPYGHVFKFGL